MKLLTGLSVLQIVAILFLATRITSLEPDTQAPAPEVDNETISEPVGILRAPAEPVTIQPRPDERQLRKTVREEMSALLRALATSDQEQAVNDLPDPATAAERQIQKALVEQELNHYISQGTISAVEMHHLEAEIARLEKDGQKEMLGRLVQAINSGELEGRL